MGFTAVAIGAGVLIGFLRGGRLRNLGAHELRGMRLVAAGVALQAAALAVTGALGLTLVTLSYGALVVAAAMNWRVIGIAVAGIGIALNAFMIVLNAGMPVRAAAIIDAGIADPDDAASFDVSGKRHVETEDDRLVVLGDVIPVRPLRAVLSFGDLILAVGLADAVAVLMRRARMDTEPEALPAAVS